VTATLPPETGQPPSAQPEIGRARARKEDARLIIGRSRYTDSITPHATVHMYVVRSPLAHASVTGVDSAP
jgi:carbon-monoxide dehydrogenase large subunit